MEKYDIQIMTYTMLRDKIEIPRFQRSPVWSDDKKKKLIETIKKGLPIGSILLSEHDSKFELVDGLQRFSTLRDFERNKFKYVNEEEITEENIYGLIGCDDYNEEYVQVLLKSNKKKIFDTIRELIVKEITNFAEYNSNSISWQITKKLQSNSAIFTYYNKEKLQSAVFDLIEKINQVLDISNLKIPVIIFNNSSENKSAELIEIFTKMNSEGVKLSKYDIFSASWQDIIIHIDSDKGKEILETVINKYQTSAEISGLEISNFDPDELRINGDINIFEYAYALSKIISKKSKFLFKAANESKVDSLGFTLLAGIFNISNKNMQNLGDEIRKYNIDFVRLIETFIEIINILEKILNGWVCSFNSKYYSCHSELQLASYIILLHKLKYKIETNRIKSEPKVNEIRMFKCFLHKHYLYDIIRDYWAGSGDSKLDEIISNTISNRYLLDIDKVTFESQILSWLDEQNNKNKVQISSEVKLFLNYIHKGSFIANEINDLNFDFDHIITKKAIKVRFSDKGINVPISTPCNLAIIPMFDNRSKRELTYYQLACLRKNAIELNESTLRKCCYPEEDEIGFVNSDDNFTISRYILFLNERKKYLTNRLLKIMYND